MLAWKNWLLIFFDKLENLPWILGAIIFSTVFMFVAMLGIVLVRKLVNPQTLKNHHDVAGFVYANLGVIYGVLLGFTVVDVQQRFDKIDNDAEIESSYLAALYRDAEVFPEEGKNQIRQAIKDYTLKVVNEEWKMMSEGVRNVDTINAFRQIWKVYYSINPSSKKEEIWYTESIAMLNELMNARLARILGSDESLGPEMWTLLILGGIFMVLFLWLFALENLALHLLLGSILAISIAFLLYLIYSLDTAFSGSVTVHPEAFLRIINSLNL